MAKAKVYIIVCPRFFLVCTIFLLFLINFYKIVRFILNLRLTEVLLIKIFQVQRYAFFGHVLDFN